MAGGGLSASLTNALSGLNVNQQALALLSQNIANANTKGYSRKVVVQGTQTINGNGVGVRIQDITRKVDLYLINTIQLQASAVGKSDVQRDYSDRTQLLFGSPGASNSLNTFVTSFFNQMQSLGQTPNDATLKSGAVHNAVNMATQVNRLARDLQELRYQIDQDIASAIPTINSNLQQIASLNGVIVNAKLVGRPVTELEDQRDMLVRDVAQYMDIQVLTRENGAVNIGVNGTSLLDDRAYVLFYTPVASTEAVIENDRFGAITAQQIDESGSLTGPILELVSAGTSAEVVSSIASGKIRGYINQRDVAIPKILAQLDEMASTLRDNFNAVHNSGSSFPGAASYTGSRLVSSQDFTQWSGRTRIAVLGSDGQPIPSGYSHISGGLPPLTIDFSRLNGGQGNGYPTVQSIVDEINQYYGGRQDKVEVGNISNIRLASNTNRLSASSTLFNFDLDFENLSELDSSVFVTGLQVLDDAGNDITSITRNAPSIDISATNSFLTSDGSTTLTIATESGNGLSDGDVIYLPDLASAIFPLTEVNGIPLTDLSGKAFTVSSVTSNSFQITAASPATSTGTLNATSATVLPVYSTLEPGESARSSNPLEVSFGAATSSVFFTVKATVAVRDEDGNLSTSTISYQVNNNQTNIRNKRYSVEAATGDGNIFTPASGQPLARAMLVDANGNELAKTNGVYSLDDTGYLMIRTVSGSHVISIDSLDSTELGQPSRLPPIEGTNRAFSHYFGLNNFFVSDDSAADTLTHSALRLEVDPRLIADSNLITTGKLSLVPAVPGQDTSYAYERSSNDQRIINALAALGIDNASFSAAGGIGARSQTYSSYTAQIISLAATNATVAKSDAENNTRLLEGFDARSLAISGVNLDEELANTVIYQNAYAASARVVTTTKELFDVLLDSV